MTGRLSSPDAGPGYPDLPTVRAARVLATADVIVHDRPGRVRALDPCRDRTECVVTT